MTPETNPYLAPKSHIPIPDENRAIVLASKGRRFGTFVVDYAVNMGFGAIVGVIIALGFGEAGVEAIQKVPDIVFGWVLLIGYYIVFEGMWARTPGKLVFGTVVVNESGGKPTLKQVIGRTFCRLIPFEAFSFLGERGWHDSIPNTHVVLARSVRPE
jgi:uncharacterized RDD family membrane protein YckC